jgi:hypothetical protein
MPSEGNIIKVGSLTMWWWWWEGAPIVYVYCRALHCFSHKGNEHDDDKNVHFNATAITSCNETKCRLRFNGR